MVNLLAPPTLIEKLSNDHGAYNLINSRLRPSKCFEGTRQKLISDVTTWFRSEVDSSPQIFFLNGMAGIGKSAVASTVCSLAEERKELGASYFFSRIHGRTDPAKVFISFASQLVKRGGSMEKEIDQALQDDPDPSFDAIKNQLAKLIVQPLLRLPNPPSRLLFVIDALDECLEAGATELLSHLLSQLTVIPFVKVLITGQPEQHIISTFNQIQRHQGVVMHGIEQQITEKDAEIYLTARFEEIQRQFRAVGIDWKWTEQQLKILVKRSGKLFVYAVTVSKYIGDLDLAIPEAQMRKVLDAKTPPNSLDSSSPYTELDILYLQVFQSILPPATRDGQLLDHFQRLIGSIVTVAEPLPLESLARLTNIPEGHARVVLKRLPSVISVPEGSQGVPHIHHSTFYDFIKDPARCTDEDLLVNLSRTNSLLASRCLELMTSNLKRDICDIKDPSKLNEDIEGLEGRVEKAIPPWLRYAYLYWGEYLSGAPVGDEGVMASLENFCRRGVMYWLEALSLLGCLGKAVSFLERVREWAVSDYAVLCYTISDCTSAL